MDATKLQVRIKDQDHAVSADDILNVARRESPGRVNAYYVEIAGQRFPPKQLLRGAIPKAGPFDTGVAVRTLLGLGFTVVKIEEP